MDIRRLPSEHSSHSRPHGIHGQEFVYDQDNSPHPIWPDGVASETLYRRRVRGMAALERLGQSGEERGGEESCWAEKNNKRTINALPSHTVDYQAGPVISRGDNSTATICVNLETGQLMIMKEFRRGRGDDASGFTGSCECIVKEFNALRRSSAHPNIIQPLGIQVTPKSLRICTEYVAGGSLRGIVDKFGKLDERTTQLYVQQAAQALLHLHSRSITHGMITARSFLLCTDGTVKLNCLGATQHVRAMMCPGGAPEPGVDVWGLGLTCLELLTAKPIYYPCPDAALRKLAWLAQYSERGRFSSVGRQSVRFDLPADDFTAPSAVSPDMDPAPVVDPIFEALDLWHLPMSPERMAWARSKVLECLPPLQLPSDMSPKAREFVAYCFTLDSRRRPSMAELVTHAFITDPVDVIPQQVGMVQLHAAANAVQSVVSAVDVSTEESSRASSRSFHMTQDGSAHESFLKVRSSTYGMSRGMSDGTTMSRISDVEPYVERLLPTIHSHLLVHGVPHGRGQRMIERDDDPLVMPDGWGLFDPKMESNRAVGNPELQARVDARRKVRLDEHGRTFQQRMFIERWNTRMPESAESVPFRSAPPPLPETREADPPAATPSRRKWWNIITPGATPGEPQQAGRMRSTSFSEFFKRFSPAVGKPGAATPEAGGAESTRITPR